MRRINNGASSFKQRLLMKCSSITRWNMPSLTSDGCMTMDLMVKLENVIEAETGVSG